MKSLQVGLAVCAAAVAALPACDQGAEQDANQSTATSCAIESFDATWWNQAFPEQSGMFHAEFVVDVTSQNMDLVVGLSNGAATRWASLATIVRFNPQGYLDARDAGAYRADASVPYQSNTRYSFRFDVDVRTRTYSVWFKQDGWTAYAPLARDYRFRTEQASATKLTNVAAFVNPETSASGSANICGFAVTQDNTTADGCMAATAGGGFSNAVVTPSSTVSFVQFRAKPGEAAMDGVVGVALGDVDAYEDYAASIRFFTNGYIEARDGDQYRADVAIAYTAGQQYDFRMLADLGSHTYSVYVSGPGVDPDDPGGNDFVRLASGYRFRFSQAGITSVDRIASIVASESGRVDACGLDAGPHQKNVVALRDGNFQVVPLTGGGALLNSAQRSIYLREDNSEGWSVFGSTRIAADAANNVYTVVSSAGNEVMFLGSVTLSRSPRWSREYPINGAIYDMIVNSAGELVLFTTSTACNYIRFSAATGEVIACHDIPPDAASIGLGADRFAVARRAPDGYYIGTYSYSGQLLREIMINGNYWISAIAVGPDGSFVLTGQLTGPMNFGDGEINWYAPSPDSGVFWDQYIAAFAPDFTLRFSRRLTNNAGGLVTNGREIAISFQTWTQLPYTDYSVFDTTGTLLRGSTEDSIIGPWGNPAGTIALTDSGRIYWNLWASLRAPHGRRFPILVTIDP